MSQRWAVALLTFLVFDHCVNTVDVDDCLCVGGCLRFVGCSGGLTVGDTVPPAGWFDSCHPWRAVSCLLQETCHSHWFLGSISDIDTLPFLSAVIPPTHSACLEEREVLSCTLYYSLLHYSWRFQECPSSLSPNSCCYVWERKFAISQMTLGRGNL